MARRARRFIFLLTLLIAAAGPWPGTSPKAGEPLNAETAATIEAARRRIGAGQYAEAVRLLRPTVENERVPPALMAQGFLYRGIASLELGQLVAALSDFGNALWLEALPARLAGQAHLHRARAHARLGGKAEARADLAQAARLAPDDPMVAAAVRAANGRPAAGAAELPTGAIPRPGPSPAGDPARRGYGVQLGALADVTGARAEWARIIAVHGDLLSGLEPRFEPTAPGGRRLVRLRAGPLATLEASRKLCARLRARGQDCFPTGR